MEFVFEPHDSACGTFEGSECMHAGQAVVQFAKHTASEQEFAVKFFLSAAAFSAERGQYTDKSTPLWRFLPQLQVGLSEALRGGGGHAARPLDTASAVQLGRIRYKYSRFDRTNFSAVR